MKKQAHYGHFFLHKLLKTRLNVENPTFSCEKSGIFPCISGPFPCFFQKIVENIDEFSTMLRTPAVFPETAKPLESMSSGTC
jgi:hypothetical protein